MLGKWQLHAKKFILDYFLTPYTKINSKWIKEFIRPETINLLKENIGSVLFDIDLSNIFWYVSSGRGNKSKNKQMGLYQTKKHSKRTINKMKRLPTEWEKIFANEIPDKRLISKKYKESTQLNIKNNHHHNNKTTTKNHTTYLKNGQRIWIGTFSKEDIQVANGLMKNAQHHSSSGKCKSKPQWGITSHLSEWLVSKRQQ